MKKLLLILGMLLAFANIGYAAQLNINDATVEQLQTLPGIGPVKAKTIVDDRKKNGPFKSVDDLKRVNGVGPKTIDGIRADVTVNVGGLSNRRSLGSSAPAPHTAPQTHSTAPQTKSTALADTSKKPAGK